MGPSAGSAGPRAFLTMPALQQLSQEELNMVMSQLEPKALAIAGACGHSACLRYCVEAGGVCSPYFGAAAPRCSSLHAPCIRLHLSASHAGCASRALRVAAESEPLWRMHCTARWKYANKHLRRAGAGGLPPGFSRARDSVCYISCLTRHPASEEKRCAAHFFAGQNLQICARLC